MRNEIPQTRKMQEAAARVGAFLDMAQLLAGDGSDRRFYRLLGSPTVVLLLHPGVPLTTVNENDSYYLIGTHFQRQGVPVPEIYHYCREEGWLLLEDLGDVSLQKALPRGVQPGVARYWYRQALEVLLDLQIKGRHGFERSWCYDTDTMDRSFLLERECRYFVRAFVNGYAGVAMGFEELAGEFGALLERALPTFAPYVLHRDFQSRNLLLKDGRLRVIDFQGARLGPLGYDVAALLIDPYVDLAPWLQEELLTHYLELLEKRLPLATAAFREQYYYLALCRNLQILGAFGFLSTVKGKDYFRRYIPTALKNLARRLEERRGEFPKLEKLVARLQSLT